MDYTVLNVVMLCISMIVASVPECLPIAITATLSIGVSEMAKKNQLSVIWQQLKLLEQLK